MNELEELGLSPYESKAYITLLELGTSKGINVANKSNIPRTSCYPVLEKLATKGLVQITGNKPKYFQAIKPEIALKALIERKKESITQKYEEALKSIKNTNTKDEQDKIFETFIGREQSYPSAKKAMKLAKKKCYIMTEGKPSTIIHFKNDWLELKKRGIDLKIISFNKNQETKHLKKQSIPIKQGGAIDFSMTLIDDVSTGLTIKSEDLPHKRLALKTRHKNLTIQMAKFFLSEWNKAKD